MSTRQAGGVALVLVVISIFLTIVFRSIELVEERQTLSGQYQSQESQLAAAAKLRRQFDALAAGVAELAALGNIGAKSIIEEMQREGVALPAKH